MYWRSTSGYLQLLYFIKVVRAIRRMSGSCYQPLIWKWISFYENMIKPLANLRTIEESINRNDCCFIVLQKRNYEIP